METEFVRPDRVVIVKKEGRILMMLTRRISLAIDALAKKVQQFTLLCFCFAYVALTLGIISRSGLAPLSSDA